jgi:hypothetical protein
MLVLCVEKKRIGNGSDREETGEKETSSVEVKKE